MGFFFPVGGGGREGGPEGQLQEQKLTWNSKICFAICTRNFICQEREVKSREAYNTIPIKILEVVLLVKQVDDLSQI